MKAELRQVNKARHRRKQFKIALSCGHSVKNAAIIAGISRRVARNLIENYSKEFVIFKNNTGLGNKQTPYWTENELLHPPVYTWQSLSIQEKHWYEENDKYYRSEHEISTVLLEFWVSNFTRYFHKFKSKNFYYSALKSKAIRILNSYHTLTYTEIARIVNVNDHTAINHHLTKRKPFPNEQEFLDEHFEVFIFNDLYPLPHEYKFAKAENIKQAELRCMHIPNGEMETEQSLMEKYKEFLIEMNQHG